LSARRSGDDFDFQPLDSDAKLSLLSFAESSALVRFQTLGWPVAAAVVVAAGGGDDM